MGEKMEEKMEEAGEEREDEGRRAVASFGALVPGSGAGSEHRRPRAQAAERSGAAGLGRRRPALHTAENGAGAFAAVALGLGLGGLWRPLPVSL